MFYATVHLYIVLSSKSFLADASTSEKRSIMTTRNGEGADTGNNSSVMKCVGKIEKGISVVATGDGLI